MTALLRRKILSQVIRVDHAGEYGAVKIYEGQLISYNQQIQEMLEQEQQHLDLFTSLLKKYDVRSSVFLMFWHIYGRYLGIISSVLKLDMQCTESVEDVIEKHYLDQIKIGKKMLDSDLVDILTKTRDEEIEHFHVASTQSQKKSNLFHKLTQLSCKVAIFISEIF